LRAFAPCCEHKARRIPDATGRHAKSAKQVRAPMRLQPSTVADSASCEIGEEQGRAEAGVRTCSYGWLLIMLSGG